jgi:transketolase
MGRHVRYDAADPHWPDRDRLLLPASRPDVPDAAAMVLPGPPGLAFGAALGLAVAERLLAARFGRSLVDHRCWVLAEPADLASGTAQEAAYAAGGLALGRLGVLAALPQDNPRLLARFAATGWTVRRVAAGDAAAADAAVSACLRSQKPTLIVEIGVEADTPAADSAEPHEADDVEEAGSPAAGRRGAGARRAWLKRLRRHANREAFQQALGGTLQAGWQKSVHADDPPPQTETAARAALQRLGAVLPDLANVRPPPEPVPPGNGARAHSWEGLDMAAAAACLGMAMHGGVLPWAWGGAELADLAVPALRVAASQRLRGLTVLTAGTAPVPPLPAMPNLHVFVPADAAEAADCLVLAVRRQDGPSVLVVSGAVPARLPPATPRLCTRGFYLVHAPPVRDATLLAAGPGLALALEVHGLLTAQGVQAALVSMPCRALFDAQDETYRQGVLGTARRIVFGAEGADAASGLTGVGDIVLGKPPVDAAAVAAAILRRVHRSPPELEAS